MMTSRLPGIREDFTFKVEIKEATGSLMSSDLEQPQWGERSNDEQIGSAR